MTAKPLGGLDLIISDMLPCPPSNRENTRRIVRHGLADWIRYAGDEVGPAPGEPIHAIQYGRTLAVSREQWGRFSEAINRGGFGT